MSASDFCAGALIFVVSLPAAPCTCCYRFMASFHCVPISKTCLAAHLSFKLFVNFSFWLFSRDFFESRWFFFSMKISTSGVEVMFLVFIQVVFFTSRRLYSFFLVHCHSFQYTACYSRGCRSGGRFWYQRKRIWLDASQETLKSGVKLGSCNSCHAHICTNRYMYNHDLSKR